MSHEARNSTIGLKEGRLVLKYLDTLEASSGSLALLPFGSSLLIGTSFWPLLAASESCGCCKHLSSQVSGFALFLLKGAFGWPMRRSGTLQLLDSRLRWAYRRPESWFGWEMAALSRLRRRLFITPVLRLISRVLGLTVFLNRHASTL